MPIYADTAYYKTVYCGSLSAEDYERCAPRATAYIEAISRRPINPDDGSMSDLLCSAVKNACCAVAEVFFRFENGGGIVKESNDGVSVTYRSSLAKAIASPEIELAAAARMYLAHTGLLYAGI